VASLRKIAYIIAMQHFGLGSNAIDEIAGLARRYIWWPAAGESGFPLARQMAQIMRYGTYDDIRRLERLADEDVLARVMIESQPGWFDDRSWHFWRGRLSTACTRDIPEQRPSRSFNHHAPAI
jgi:hypothetical protein